MTELIWAGKYDAKGKRTAPVRIALPFQTVETVNESARERQLTLDSMVQGRESAWRNRLIWGDKKYVLPSLLPEFAGKVDLIYIDPPFDTGADFSFTTQTPESDATFVKEPNMVRVQLRGYAVGRAGAGERGSGAGVAAGTSDGGALPSVAAWQAIVR